MKFKLFNLGLPKTGTTSFHDFMISNGYKSCHLNDGFIKKCFPGDFFDFIDGKTENNLIAEQIEKYDVFNDLPWYSKDLRKPLLDYTKQGYKIIFVATLRRMEDWVRSIKTIKKPIVREGTELYHTYEYGNIFLKNEFCDDDLRKFYLQHYQKLDKRVIRLSLNNTEDIVKTLSHHLPLKNFKFPHSNKTK